MRGALFPLPAISITYVPVSPSLLSLSSPLYLCPSFCLFPCSCSLTSLLVPCPSIFLPLAPFIPPPSCPPRSASSPSKQVFGCQCLSVSGTDESVTLPVQLVMTITADCCISVGETISTLCGIDLSPHRSMSERRVNMMRDGFSRKRFLFFFFPLSLKCLEDKMAQKVPFTYRLTFNVVSITRMTFV